jgi:hypothetical protein
LTTEKLSILLHTTLQDLLEQFLQSFNSNCSKEVIVTASNRDDRASSSGAKGKEDK